MFSSCSRRNRRGDLFRFCSSLFLEIVFSLRTNFGIGDYVLVARREPKKIEPRWFRPVRIVREVNPKIYEIELLDGSESTITAVRQVLR